MLTDRLPHFAEHPIEWTDEKVSRLWNYYARTPPYSELYFSKLHGRELLQASGLPLHAPLHVLDFGCGPGFIWEHLRQLQARWNYTGLDFSPESVGQLCVRAKGHPLFGGAHQVQELPSGLPDASFDVVLLFEVVEHLDDTYLSNTLDEATRLLKRGGVMVISTPNEEDIDRARLFCPDCGSIFHQWQHVRSWSVEALSSRVARLGFTRRTAKVADFSAHGLPRRLKAGLKRLVQGQAKPPHMIATFQKN